MTRLVAVLLAAGILAGFSPAPGAGAQAGGPEARQHGPAGGDHRLQVTYPDEETASRAGRAPMASAYAPTAEASSSDPSPALSWWTAVDADEFVLDFDPAFADSQKAAITAAAATWAAKLRIDVPVDVEVHLDDEGLMPSGALGGAAPWAYWGWQDENTAYPTAVFNQFAGEDVNPGQPDIIMVFSGEDIFYDGIDAVPSDKYSLQTVALHELGHGLGHATWARDEAGTLRVKGDDGSVNVFDTHVRSAGTRITALGSTALQTALEDPLKWYGVDGKRLYGGTYPPLYAPNTFENGSSVSHLDLQTHLMAPYIDSGVSILTVPNVTLGMMADIGWIMDNKSGQQAFVAALTNDFLKRAGTPDEIYYFVSLLRSGYTRSDIVGAYAFSDEWVGVIVDGFYLSTLGRLPDADGRQYWIDRIKDGMTPATVGAAFYASAEYFKRTGGTNKLWVESLYKEILGRTGDSGGVSFWVGRLNSGTSRQVVAYDFYQSIESRRKRVTALYKQLLQRKPDSGGLEYWAGILKNGRDVELAIFLASSSEYYKLATNRF
jgi:hypothetical protein